MVTAIPVAMVVAVTIMACAVAVVLASVVVSVVTGDGGPLLVGFAVELMGHMIVRRVEGVVSALRAERQSRG